MNNYGQCLVAHRGFSAAYPENTMLALQSALALGACFLEVDVHLSADNIPVVVHDADLRRTAGKDIKVLQHPLSHLQEYSVHEPNRFANRYYPQRIPTLEAVAELVRGYSSSTLFIEAKRASIKHFGVETFLDALSPVIEMIPNQCVLISFDAQFVAAVKQIRICPIGWVFDDWGKESFDIIARLQPEYVFTDYAAVPAQYESLPQGAWQWVLYTIDDAELALHWFQKGATLVETNNFGALIKHPAFTAEG